MIKVKHILFLLLFLVLSSTQLYSNTINNTPLVNPFPSEENLNNFEKVDSLNLYNENELDNIEISLITIAPGDPIYGWFGHSAILVQQKDQSSIIYDYGIFSFNSKNFYKNFIMGKMYYLLMPSLKNQRLSLPKEDDRTINKVVLNISDKNKVNIINFLNFNSQDENNTYLYDFYIDNCATRIRDIFNWVSDDDFKTWAQNQYTPFTFRILSTEQLDKSLAINWVLNSFLGSDCDKPTSTWENMFAPHYLEQAVIDYQKFNTDISKIYESESASTFDNEYEITHHLLFYAFIGLILGLIGLSFKQLKQDKKSRIFGIYNSVLTLFLLIISGCITFLMFFSHIQFAWNNENILFLNPLFCGILFISSLSTIKKKKRSTRNLIIYERLCNVYSVYLMVFIIVKVIYSDIFIQQNFIIIIPILLFFFVQSFILFTRR